MWACFCPTKIFGLIYGFGGNGARLKLALASKLNNYAISTALHYNNYSATVHVRPRRLTIGDVHAFTLFVLRRCRAHRAAACISHACCDVKVSAWKCLDQHTPHAHAHISRYVDAVPHHCHHHVRQLIQPVHDLLARSCVLSSCCMPHAHVRVLVVYLPRLHTFTFAHPTGRP